MFAACSNGERTSGGTSSQNPESYLEAQSSDNSLSDSTDSTEPDQSGSVPVMDTEQQALHDKYLEPLLYSNFFHGKYYSKTLDTEWDAPSMPGAGIITIYQDLVGMDVWTAMYDDQYQIPAADVESVLMRYFPFDEQTIQIMAGPYYNPASSMYTMVERGGGPRAIVVTGSSPINEDVLEISYDFYGPGDSYTADNQHVEKAFSGEVQIQFIEEGVFHYISNEIIRD